MKQMLSTVAVLAIASTAAWAEEVRVYNWSDYIDEELLTKFEAETGIKLIYDVFRQQRSFGNQNVGWFVWL